MRNKNIISLDIDGILTDYPKCWLQFLYLQTGKNFKSVQHAKIKLKDDYSRLKSVYRRSEYKEFLPLLPQAELMLNFFRDKGYNFVVSTSRPILSPDFPALYTISKNWVSRNVGPDCPVYFKDETLQHIPNLHEISFHIDDEMRYAHAFACRDVFTYLITAINVTDKKEEGQVSANILSLKTHDDLIRNIRSEEKP